MNGTCGQARVVLHLACVVSLLMMTMGCGARRGTDPKEQEVSRSQAHISIAWKPGLPAHRLREFCKAYTDESGVEVRIGEIPDQIFHDGVMTLFEKHSKTAFDAVIADSHWLAGAVEAGYYADMSDFLKRDIGFERVDSRLREVLSEFPQGSGAFFSAPVYPDMMVLLYRKDWYSDEETQEDYRLLYGEPLVPPRTLAELKNHVSYFSASVDHPAGIAFLTRRREAELVLSFQAFLSMEGGRLSNPDTYEVDGVLNASNAVAAVETMSTFIRSGPPGASELSSEGAALHFIKGNVALSVNWLSMVDGIVDSMPDDEVGVLALPGGAGQHVSPIRGYGLSISEKLPAERKAMCEDFLRWFYRADVQKRWIAQGGLPVMSRDVREFEHKVYGSVYAESIAGSEAFWQVKVYDRLIPVLNRCVGDAVDGYVPVQQSLDTLAVEWELILREAELLNRF